MMMFQPGIIQSGIAEEVVGQRSMGRGATYRERLSQWIPCLDCGMELMMGSMTSHRRHLHRTESAIKWDRLPIIKTENLPQIF